MHIAGQRSDTIHVIVMRGVVVVSFGSIVVL